MIRSPKILVVDDEPGMGQAPVRLMHTAGFAMLEASSGYEALRQVREARPDLGLLDVRPADIDGLDHFKKYHP